MATNLGFIDDQTTLKQNFANTNEDEDGQNLVFRQKQRVWVKLYRIKDNSVDKAIILPFDTFVEPFFTIDDIDTSNTTGKYDSVNELYKLYTDANGNYKTIQSEYICWQNDRTIKTVNVTVYATDSLGNKSNNYEIFVYNGNEWVATTNGYSVSMIDYTGAQLDSILNTPLSGQLSNKDTDGNILFQNKLKWKINRIGYDEVRITKVIIKVTWNEAWTDDIYGIDGFPTPFGTWGSI